MSLLLNKNSSKTGTPLFHEFKKQASFFLKEKFKTARLALTDVTPAELMTEEATNGNLWVPDSPTLRSISRAAFELDDYWRIVEILHKRASYNALIVLEHLLTHGPESVAEEFRSDRDAISQMKCFQYIDDSGFNWGLVVRKKSEWILKLLEEGTLLKEERNRARRLSRGIQGFGSFNRWSTSPEKSWPTMFDQCNSDFGSHENQGNQYSCSNHYIDRIAAESPGTSQQCGILNPMDSVETESYLDDQMFQKSETSSKETMTPIKKEFHLWNLKGESNPLLDGGQEDDSKNGIFIAEDDHPFNSTERHASFSLISLR